jgi:O-antigen/teichoic acid export membrane protein
MFRSQIRPVSAIFFGHICIALIGIASLRLITELAPLHVFGEANLIVTALLLGQQIVIAPLYNTILRYQTESSDASIANEFSRQALAWSLVSAAVLTVVVALCLSIWASLNGRSVGTIIIAAGLWLIAGSVKTTIMYRFHAERRQPTFMALAVLEAFLLAAGTAAALKLSPTSEMYLAGYAGGGVCLAIVCILVAPWPVLPGLRWPSRHSRFFEKVMSYGVAFTPLAALGWLSNLADRYTLGFFLGSAAVGQYLAAFAVANRGMALASGGMADLFRPMLFEAENRGDRGKAHRVFLAWLVATFVASIAALIAIYFLGAWIAWVVLSESYRSGSTEIMLWITFGYGIYGITQIIECRLLSLHASTRLILPLAFGGIANLVFSFALVPWVGITGAAQASCASFAVQGVVTTVALINRLRKREPGKDTAQK